jgi:Zinc-binding dehydrogenase
LGSSCAIAYDDDGGDEAIRDRLTETVAARGQFAIVLDTVRSSSAVDLTTNYSQMLLGRKDSQGYGMMSERGHYVTLGGHTWEWILAALRWHCGMHWLVRTVSAIFSYRRELFWVSLNGRHDDLEELANLCESRSIKIAVEKVYPFTVDGVKEAWQRIMARRTVGKLCVSVDNSSNVVC